jgi:hypothetical protein
MEALVAAIAVACQLKAAAAYETKIACIDFYVNCQHPMPKCIELYEKGVRYAESNN